MHPPIPVGLATKIGIAVSILGALPPFIMQLVALVENTSLHFTEANKISLISGAAIAAITIASRGIQAIAAIVKGP